MIYDKNNESFQVTENNIRNINESQGTHLDLDLEGKHRVRSNGGVQGTLLASLPLTGELTEQTTSQM